MPPAASAGKSFEQVEPLVERRDHLGRGRHAGDHEHVELPAPLDHRAG